MPNHPQRTVYREVRHCEQPRDWTTLCSLISRLNDWVTIGWLYGATPRATHSPLVSVALPIPLPPQNDVAEIVNVPSDDPQTNADVIAAMAYKSTIKTAFRTYHNHLCLLESAWMRPTPEICLNRRRETRRKWPCWGLSFWAPHSPS
jgi:hypothetical protein